MTRMMMWPLLPSLHFSIWAGKPRLKRFWTRMKIYPNLFARNLKVMSPKEKAVVLLSGGLDSTVALAEAVERYEVILIITFNYGQWAFGKEIKASRLIAECYGVPHEIIPLPWLAALLPTTLRYRKSSVGPMSKPDWLDPIQD